MEVTNVFSILLCHFSRAANQELEHLLAPGRHFLCGTYKIKWPTHLFGVSKRHTPSEKQHCHAYLDNAIVQGVTCSFSRKVSDFNVGLVGVTCVCVCVSENGKSNQACCASMQLGLFVSLRSWCWHSVEQIGRYLLEFRMSFV